MASRLIVVAIVLVPFARAVLPVLPAVPLVVY